MIQTMKEKKIEWVDVHNDALMVSLGIRQPDLSPKDPECWTKTSKEKKILKRLRKRHKHSITTSSIIPSRFIPVYSKLIIQLYKNDQFNKTTYSTMCWQSDIANILSRYMSIKNKSLVSKYYWNGKWYKSNELPFWHSKD